MAAGIWRSLVAYARVTVTESMWSARTPLVATLPRRNRIIRNLLLRPETVGARPSRHIPGVRPIWVLPWTAIGIRASAVVMMVE